MAKSNRFRIQHGVFGIVTALLLQAGVGLPAFAQEVHRFQINTTDAATAIHEFGNQSGVQILASAEALRGKRLNEVSGDLSTDDGLQRLLADTGLSHRYVGERAVALVSDSPVAGSDSSRTSSTGPHAFNNPETPNTGTARKPGFWERFRLAQNNSQGSKKSDTSSAEREKQNDQNPEKDSDRVTLEEIVVTGTHIRGEAAIGARVEVIDRQQIDRSGYATSQQVVQSLPQNFQGGPNEDTTGSPEGRGTFNEGLGAGINLRGLGGNSTLTLVNGRRLAASGFGTFVDVSTIPATAIQRVEVLPDGASALYGSDAIGGVVNIILRNDYEGAETRVRFGTVTDGDLNEYQFGQLFGTAWETGRAMISYEYYQRENLKAEDRDFYTQDLRPFGGDDFRVEFSNPGNITDFVQTFAIPEGQDGRDLAAEDLLPGVVNLLEERQATDVLPKQERHSIFASVTAEFDERISLFAEALYSQREFETRGRADVDTLFVPASNPFFVDPFGGSESVFVQYSFIDDLGPEVTAGKVRTYTAAGGVNLDITDAWQADAFASYSRVEQERRDGNFANRPALEAALADPNPATAFNPFGDGSHTNPTTIERIKGFRTNDQTFELWSANVKADGPLFRLPGGDVKLAIGAEYREESFETTSTFFISVPEPDVRPASLQERNIKAAFAELLIPLVGEGNRLLGVERLDVSVAGRVEDYSDFGSTTDPKVGILWSPIPSLAFRGTYGTSFRAPGLFDLDESQNLFFDFVLDDPKSLSGSTTIIGLSGSNADLGPEEATTWTAGVDFRPQTIPELAFELTYFDVEIENRIVDGFSEFFTILVNEEQFAARITRNPDLATVQALFDDPNFLSFFGSTPEDIEAIVDFRLKNIAILDTNGIDFTTSYGFDTDFGRFGLRLNASFFFEFNEAQTPTALAFDALNTVRNPVDWRMRNSLSWDFGGFSATAFINYTDEYRDDESDPERRIGSWTTVDLNLAYDTQDRPGKPLWHDVVFSLSILNLFDSDPPFVNNQRGFGYDPENADALGRLVALQVAETW